MTIDNDSKRLSTPPEARDDRFARESFTFRRMQPWQIWTMATLLVVLSGGLLAAALA
jgi:hypothetical protein